MLLLQLNLNVVFVVVVLKMMLSLLDDDDGGDDRLAGHLLFALSLSFSFTSRNYSDHFRHCCLFMQQQQPKQQLLRLCLGTFAVQCPLFSCLYIAVVICSLLVCVFNYQHNCTGFLCGISIFKLLFPLF